MTHQILAQGGRFLAGWSLVDIIVAILIIAGVFGVAYIVLQKIGVTIPPWLIQIFWICVAVFVGIVAIRFLSSL